MIAAQRVHCDRGPQTCRSNVDFEEFCLMLRTAKEATSVFTGTEVVENVSARQLEALLLYEFPDRPEGPGDTDETGGLGGFIDQIRADATDSDDQDEREARASAERQRKVDNGDRSHPQLRELDELELDLKERALSQDDTCLADFPTWQQELKHAEQVHILNPEGFDFVLKVI